MSDERSRLKRLLEQHWDAPFISHAATERAWTYGDFWAAAQRWSAELDRGRVLAAVMDNGPELACLYFAAALAGCQVAPIDPRKGDEEIERILSVLEEPVVLSDGRWADAVPAQEMTGAKGEVVSDERLGAVDFERPFLVSFTSGSTGEPKGVVHTLGNLLRAAEAFRDRFGFGRENVWFHNLPMTYMAGILNLIVLPFVSGSRLVLGERFGIAQMMDFWRVPIAHGVNTLWTIPTIIHLLLKVDRGEEGVAYCRSRDMLACVGTAPLAGDKRRAFEERYGIPIYESYGLSETLFVTTNAPEHCERDTVGRALPGVELQYAEDGEIHIATPWSFIGYYGDAAAEPVFASGDLGETRDGYLRITGRKKDLIIKGGMNISPARITEILQGSEGLEEHVVIGMPDDNLGERIVCFYVGAELDEAALNRAVVTALGPDWRIDQFVRKARLPKNLNGKVDKRKLREEEG